MLSDPNCVFCKIVAGAIPSFRIYEDERTQAFMDINPANDGHCLVIPKAHYPTIFAIPAEEFGAASRAALRIANAVNQALIPDGINILQANGPGAAQSVFHLHIHVLPRQHDDGLLLNWTPKPGDRTRIAELAEKIKQAL